MLKFSKPGFSSTWTMNQMFMYLNQMFKLVLEKAEEPEIKLPAGGAPQKERGSGTSLSKAEGSWGAVSLLSPTQPLSQRDNHPQQQLRLSSSALLPQTLGLYRQARGFCKGWTNHVKGQILIYHSCTNHVKGQVVICFIVTGVYGDHMLSTCMEIKRANQKF